MAPVVEIDYGGAADRTLLSLYRRKRDQQAFAELVSRYYSLVLGLSQRMLGCPHSAEDVLQATFLVLAKDAHKIRRRDALASWLYGVAFRIAARQVKRRASQRVSVLKDEAMVADDPLEKLCQQYEQQAAFEELHRLPEKMRAPMVLRYLQGKSNSEVAEKLALSEAAVEGRLKRGRDQLRLRLARQGVPFVAGMAAIEATKESAHAVESIGRITKTVEACVHPRSGTDSTGTEFIQLAEEEIWKMATFTILKNAVVVAGTAAVMLVGWSLAGSVVANAQEPANEIVVKSGDVKPRAERDEAKLKTGKGRYYYYSSEPGKSDTADDDRPSSSTQEPPASGPNPNYWQYSAKSTPRATATRYSLEQYTPTERKIQETLKQQATVDFLEVPLSEAISALAEEHDLQIVLDHVAMQSEGLSPDQMVSCSLRNVRLGSVLNHILDEYRFTAMTKDEVLFVTSHERAIRLTPPRVYRFKQQWNMTTDDLITVITSSVAPNEWNEVGGPSSIVGIDGGLVISTSERIHEQINKLLAQIDRIHE